VSGKSVPSLLKAQTDCVSASAACDCTLSSLYFAFWTFRKLGTLFLISLFSAHVFAAQIGTVISEEAFIYLNSDFDAPVIATLKRGESFQMSNKPVGPFYKIRMKNNQLGWVSSIDVKAGKVDLKSEIRKEKEDRNKPLDSHVDEQKALKTYAILRHQGFFVQSSDWKEKTLGKTRKDNLLFYGWNWTGFNTLVDGPFYLDSRLMATFGAPGYYKKVTGVAAEGFILRAQASFVSANPIGENCLFHYGFGASTTYSRIKAGVLEAGVKNSFTMEDLNMGIVIPMGLSYRIGPVSTQFFFQYYIEKTQTVGLSLGINWAY
jgi:hypothetical protein